MPLNEVHEKRSRGFLVGLEITGKPSSLGIDASLEELALLADTAGIHVVGQTHQRLSHPDPATFIGSGKVDEVKYWLEEISADIVLFDDELSPRHLRELEKAFGDEVRIIDRTALILDIFAQHAHTREGALQVALAQYEYRLPRLTRQWTHLIRQAGGAAARGGAGGVGLRGPGETQLETDRREVRRRIARLEREIAQVRARREGRRRQRRRQGIPLIALIGYTNAGKSTLLNRLCGSDVYVADQLFATLDPTTRRIELPDGQQAILTDTVGFIQKLPHDVIAAFHATLEEISEAELLLHVIDASHPNALQQIMIAESTLSSELGIRDIPLVRILNKIDLVQSNEEKQVLTLLNHDFPDAIPLSALRGSGVDRLLDKIKDVLASRLVEVRVHIPHIHGDLIARFHEVAVVEFQTSLEDYVELAGAIAPRYLRDFEQFRVA